MSEKRSKRMNFSIPAFQSGLGLSLTRSKDRENGWPQIKPLYHHMESGARVRGFMSDSHVINQYWTFLCWDTMVELFSYS